ncbi:MAG TPA: glutamate synthase subunit beta, partial [Acidimicrobiales bacterium]|nr:glutamate synthase subunit beta [Acidimicrobiales bacterium]
DGVRPWVSSMGRPTGFMEHGRELPRRRPVPVRLRDWREVYEPFAESSVRTQGARCMDCGIPFCHEGCPLGNLIPEWNDLVSRGDWYDAGERLHATNNFPEMTGRLCPAPCEAACVLGIGTDPVTIERIELEIAERAWGEGWVTPHTSASRTAKRVAVVGSGPAGLACAQQLARAGHAVTVFERAEKPGGLLRYGIPEFKMEKHVLDRRLAQLRAEGVDFVCATAVGVAPDGIVTEDVGNGIGGRAGSGHRSHPPEPGEQRGLGTACAPGVRTVGARQLLDDFDALVVATGATVPRDLDVTGRELGGVHFALEYLKPANLVQEGALDESPIDARGRHVVIVGGGDTGADCLGTAHRQGAASVVQLEILPEPPEVRGAEHPWPVWPVILRTSSAHEEGGARRWSVSPGALVDDGHGRVGALRGHEVRLTVEGGRTSFEPVAGGEFELRCDLVLLAMGFHGPERRGIVAELDLELDPRGSVAVGPDWSTSLEGVFACGDAARGQSLVVWAIAEGRSAAASVDRWLMGESTLPVPLAPGQVALR